MVKVRGAPGLHSADNSLRTTASGYSSEKQTELQRSVRDIDRNLRKMTLRFVYDDATAREKFRKVHQNRMASTPGHGE